MDNSKLLDQLSSFMRNSDWVWPIETPISNTTKIEEDLKISGFDAVEFIIEYGKHFNVIVENFNAAEYFHSKGCQLCSSIFEKKNKKCLTIEDLIKGIEFGRLDKDILEK